MRFRWSNSAPPSLLLVGPNMASTVPIGTPVQIEWVAGDDIEVSSVDLWISRDGGESYSEIAIGVPNSGQYQWTANGATSDNCMLRVVARDDLELSGPDRSSKFALVSGTLAVGDRPVELALAISPNPAHGQCRFSFGLPREGKVRLRLFDLQGRLVNEVANGTFGAGRHEVVWDGRGPGGALAAGLYFATLELSGDRTLRRRLVITK